MREYWNHNSAYTPELVRAVPGPGSRVLDVGCGDGALLAALAPGTREIVGIEQDERSAALARARLADVPGGRVIVGDFVASAELDGSQFDLITCVATLHHLPLRPALERMRDLLAPGGRLRIVGLAKSRSALDWVVSGLQVVPVRIVDLMRHKRDYEGMVIAQPQETLAEIRRVAGEILPGYRIRRRLYYRYTLAWGKPKVAAPVESVTTPAA